MMAKQQNFAPNSNIFLFDYSLLSSSSSSPLFSSCLNIAIYSLLPTTSITHYYPQRIRDPNIINIFTTLVFSSCLICLGICSLLPEASIALHYPQTIRDPDIITIIHFFSSCLHKNLGICSLLPAASMLPLTSITTTNLDKESVFNVFTLDLNSKL